MENKINLTKLAKLKNVANNVYMDDNNILIEKNMTLAPKEESILDKWKINQFELRSHIETHAEGFNILYQYDKETFTRLYASIQREIQGFYESIEKGYKVPFPDFSHSLKQLSSMSTVKSLAFVFHIHLQQCNSLIKSATRTAIYSFLIAKRMGLGAEQIERVYYGSIISEIGLLKRSENYLINLLRGKTVKPFDFNYLDQHVSIGLELYKELLNYSNEYAVMLLLHHDYNDGSGYNKVTKEKLNIEVQIITLCQEFTYATTNFLQDACKPITFTNALILILQNKAKYNSDVLNAFISIFSFYPPGMFLVLSDGKIAVSVATRTNQPNYPTVEKIADEKGNMLSNPATITTERSHLKILASFNNKGVIRKIIKSLYS